MSDYYRLGLSAVYPIWSFFPFYTPSLIDNPLPYYSTRCMHGSAIHPVLKYCKGLSFGITLLPSHWTCIITLQTFDHAYLWYHLWYHFYDQCHSNLMTCYTIPNNHTCLTARGSFYLQGFKSLYNFQYADSNFQKYFEACVENMEP